MTNAQALTTLGLLIAEINRHQGAIGDILELSLQESRSETALEQEQRAAEEDNGSCHGHPGAPRRCTEPVESPYNTAPGGVSQHALDRHGRGCTLRLGTGPCNCLASIA